MTSMRSPSAPHQLPSRPRTFHFDDLDDAGAHSLRPRKGESGNDTWFRIVSDVLQAERTAWMVPLTEEDRALIRQARLGCGPGWQPFPQIRALA